MNRLREMLVRHEGRRLKPYVCSAGKLTVGVGRNLDDVGITVFESDMLLTHDIERCTEEALTYLPWFKSLSLVRQDVVVNMLMNLGLPRFLSFKKMREAIRVGNFERAAEEMLNSVWATQVGIRAQELAQMMKTGLYL